MGGQETDSQVRKDQIAAFNTLLHTTYADSKTNFISATRKIYHESGVM